MNYNKPWKGYQDQLLLLKSRGMSIRNHDKALEYLEKIGYYRLSGYWYSFRKRSGNCCAWPREKNNKKSFAVVQKLVLEEFKAGTEFQHVVDLYIFDKKLRLLCMDALERIEIGLRVEVCHLLGKESPFAYLSPDYFSDKFSQKLDSKTGLTPHQSWLISHAALINRSKESSIKHYKQKYGLPLPLWIASEVWNFGTLSTLFSGMLPEQQNQIASKYGVSKGEVFASWLRCLNYLRNLCAHHSRLWNRNVIDQPKQPLATDALFHSAWNNKHVLARPFLLLCIAQQLLSVINPNSSWWERLKCLMLEFPELTQLDIDLHAIGIIEGWETWHWSYKRQPIKNP